MMNSFDEFDTETQTLQADVMRFLAIIAFSLLVIFIPLIQVISRQPASVHDEKVQVTEADVIVNVELMQEQLEKEENQIEKEKPEQKKPVDIEPESAKEEKIPAEDVSKKIEKTVPELPEGEKVRILFFDEGAFRTLLAVRKIQGYVVLTEHNLCFEFGFTDRHYTFKKAVVQDVASVLGLRKSTLPNGLIPAFERIYPSLATRKKEFYFIPSRNIREGLNKIIASSHYGRFRIMVNEAILHEE